MSCSCGDTLASELGTVFGSDKSVYLIIGFKKVPKGTNGGISVEGTLSSGFGGFLIGLVYYLTFKICCLYKNISNSYYDESDIILIGTLSGFIGSLIDSILGSCLQYSGINTKTKSIANLPGPNIKHISGYNILTNNQVNLVSSFITTLLIPYLYSKIII